MNRCWWLLSVLTISLLSFDSPCAGQVPEDSGKLIPSFDGEKRPSTTRRDPLVRRTAFQRMVDRVTPSRAESTPAPGPSAMQRFNASTKRALAKTKMMLTPWSKTEKPARRRSFLPFWSKGEKPSKPKKSSFSWFGRKPPKPSPPTLPEFVARPKP